MAVTNLGTLVLTLEADIRQLENRLDQAERIAQKSGQEMGMSIKDGILLGIGSSIGNQITQLIVTPINIATRSIRGFIDESFAKGQNFEQFEASLKTILQSAEKAKKLIGELSEFARTTPFELPELQAATRSLLSYGFESEKLIETLRRVGDVSSALSLNINELAVIYGKGRVAGRLYQGDINELTGRGIPIIQEFAKQMGVTEGEVRKLTESGKIGFPQLEKAFISLTSEGGKFFNQMANQSQTFAGQVSNFNDQFTRAQVELFNQLKPASVAVLDSLSKVVGRVTETEGLFDDVGEAAQQFADTLKDNPELVESAAEAIKSGMVEGLKSAGEIAQELSSFLKDNPDSIAKTIELMKVFIQLLSRGSTLAAQMVSTSIDGYKKLGVLTGLLQTEAIVASERGIDPSKLQERVQALKDIGPSAVGKNESTVTENDFIREAANQLERERTVARQIRGAIESGRSPDRLDFVTPQDATVEDFREAIRQGRKIGAPPETDKKDDPSKPKPKPPETKAAPDPNAALEKQINRAIELELKRSIEVTKLVKNGVLTQEEAELQKLRATEKRIQVEISAETEKLKTLKGEEADQARQELLRKNLSLVELQLRIEETYKASVEARLQKEAQALQNKLDKTSKSLEISNQEIAIEQQKLRFLDQELSANSFLQASLERQQSLRQSIADLELTRLDSRSSNVDIQLGNLERARQLARDLASGRLSADEANVVKRDLNRIGLNPNASELQILAQIAKLSEQRREIERQTLEKQQELARKNLEFEQKRLELSKQRAAIEAQQAIESAKLQSLQSQNQAQQEALSAQGKLLEAKTALKTAETEEEKRLAQTQIEFAQQEIALAQEKLRLAEMSGQMAIEQAEAARQNTLADLNTQETKLRLQKEQLELTQQAEQDRLRDRQQDQRFDQLRDNARARQPQQSPNQPQPARQNFASNQPTKTTDLTNPVVVLPARQSAPLLSAGNNLGILGESARVASAINRPIPIAPPQLSEVNQPPSIPDIGALSGKLDKIIELLKQPNVVQNNTFNQSIGSADADLFRRLRSQSLEDLKTVANQIKIF